MIFGIQVNISEMNSDNIIGLLKHKRISSKKKI